MIERNAVWSKLSSQSAKANFRMIADCPALEAAAAELIPVTPAFCIFVICFLRCRQLQLIITILASTRLGDAMRLKSSTIRKFRRLDCVSIDFESRETVFVGPNNSGKTSATAAIRSFLGNREFKIHDFSMAAMASIDAFDPENEYNLPQIELDLWFEVDPEAIAFGRVFALATSLSSDFSEIGMRCAFAVDDVAELWKNYDAAFPIIEGNRKRPLSFFLGVEGNLKKYFSIIFFSLEKVEQELIATPLAAQEGKKILNSLLRVDFVDAQRNIDDENAARSNRLSDAFATYYRRNLEQAGTS